MRLQTPKLLQGYKMQVKCANFTSCFTCLDSGNSRGVPSRPLLSLSLCGLVRLYIIFRMEQQWIRDLLSLLAEQVWQNEVSTCEADYSVSLTLDNMYRISTYEKILTKSGSSGLALTRHPTSRVVYW